MKNEYKCSVKECHKSIEDMQNFCTEHMKLEHKAYNEYTKTNENPDYCDFEDWFWEVFLPRENIKV